MNVELPDGTIVEDIPDGTSRAAIAGKLKASGMNVPDAWLAPEKKEVGAVESALRTAGAAAKPAVRLFDMAAAGLAGILGADEEQQRIFADMETRQKRLTEQYAPKEGEEFSTVGELAGAALSVPQQMVGVSIIPGLTAGGIERASEVVERGGQMGEAVKAGAVKGGVEQVLQMLPLRAGEKIIEKVGGGVVRKVLAGGATGAAINVPAGIAGRAIENEALPEGKQFGDLQQAPFDPKAVGTDTAMAAVLGMVGARGGAKRQQAKADAAAPPPFPEAMKDLGEGQFRAPNGATVTKEAWEASSPRVRDGWMKAAPEPEKIPVGEAKEVGPEALADTTEIDRIKEQHPAGAVAEVADEVIAAKQKEAVDAATSRKNQADAAELRHAATTTTDEKLKTALLKRADKLDPPPKIPEGEVIEGQPEIKLGKEESQAPAKVKAEELPEPKSEVPTEPIAKGEAKEVTQSGVEPAPEKLPVGEAKELYADPQRKVTKDVEESNDLDLPTIDARLLDHQERIKASRMPKPEPEVLERGRRQTRAALEKGMADGTIDKDGGSLALWALDKNPNLARGLRVESGGEHGAALGSYNNAEKIVRLFKDNNRHTAAHEILHHSEHMMPDVVQRGIRREWRAQVLREMKKADAPTRDALHDVIDMMNNVDGAREKVMNSLRNGTLNKGKHYQLTDPSEFWAVNAARILSDRYSSRGSWRKQAVQWIKEMIEHVKGTAGIRSDSPVLKALNQMLDEVQTSGKQRAQRRMIVHGESRKDALDVKELKPKKPRSKEELDRVVDDIYRRYTAGEIDMDGVREARKSIEDEEVAAMRRQWAADDATPAKGYTEVHPGFTEIPKGTKVTASHGLKYAEPTRGTVVDSVDMKLGKEAYRLPLVDFGDGEPRKVMPMDIKEVFAPRSVKKAPDESLDVKVKRKLGDETKPELVERKAFDRFNRVKKLQKTEAPKSEDADIYQADQLYQGRAQHRGEELEKKFLKPLGAAMKAAKKAGVSVRDADDYLMALHAPERNKVVAERNSKLPDGGSGLTNAQAKDIIDSFTPEQRKHLDEMAKVVHDMNRAKLDALVDDGLIKPEVRDRLNKQYKKYVPLKTLDDEDDFTGIGRGYEMGKSDIKAALGRRTKAGSPIAASVMDASRSILRGEKARVDRAIFEYASDPKAQDFMEPYEELVKRGDVWMDAQGNVKRPPASLLTEKLNSEGKVEEVIDSQKVQDQTLSLVVNGEKKRVFVADELLRDQLRKVATANDPGPILGAVGRGTGTIGRMLTEFNPAFTLPNAVRDAITVGLRAGAHEGVSTAKVLVGIPKAWKTIVEHKFGVDSPDAKLYGEFLKTGGKTGAYGIQNVVDTMRHLERAGAKLGYDEHAKGGNFRATANVLRQVAKFVSNSNEVLEYASRFAVYKEARAAGYSPRKAAATAKEITVNFNRSGEYGRTMNSLFVFANAALQGLRNTVVYGKNPHVQKGMLGLVALGAAMQAYNEQMGGENEDTLEPNVNSQNDASADKNVTLLKPGSKEGFKIPLPPEYALPYTLGRRLYRAMSQRGTTPEETKERMKKEAQGIVGAVLDATLPVRLPDADSGTLAVAKAFTPTLISPVTDLLFNQNYFGQPIVPESFDKRSPPPAHTMSRSSTSEIAKSISEIANSVTGGDNVRPGWVQDGPAALGRLAAPEGIEHMAGFYAGGMGQIAMQSKNVVKNAAESKPQDINKLPIVNRFAFQEPQSYTSRRYGELAKEFEYAKDYRKAGDESKIAPKVAQALPEYEATERELRALFKELRAAPKEEKELIQKRIKAAQSRVIRSYNEFKP